MSNLKLVRDIPALHLCLLLRSVPSLLIYFYFLYNLFDLLSVNIV